MSVADALRDYVRLVLRLARLSPGAVEIGSVEPSLRRQVSADRRPQPAEIVRGAGALRDALPGLGLDAGRERCLAAQLTAVEWTARRLAGQTVPFVRELELVYGTPVAPGTEDAYHAAHRELATLLPGSGPLADRLAAHRARLVVPAPLLVPAAAALAAALRALAVDAGLTTSGDGGVTFHVTGDAPWSALHQACGGGCSRVTLNAGSRLRRDQLAQLVAHETYPGHHVERGVREAELVARLGWHEHRVGVVASPQSVLAEGTAEVGLPVLVGEGWGRWSSDVLAEHGLAFDGELAERVDAQVMVLRRVRLDAALLLHDRRAHHDDVVAHLCRWLPASRRRAAEVLRFVTDPGWRGYVVTYVEGAALVGRWLRRPGGSAAERLADLYRRPRIPAELRADVERASRDGPNRSDLRRTVSVAR